MKTETTNQIKNEVRKAYEKDGQSTAFDVASKYDIPLRYCKECCTETPSINNECLICGQTTTPIPATNQPPTLQGFTPGEWEYRQSRGNNAYEYKVEANGRTVCEMEAYDLENIKEVIANAALIASAPTLLKENTQLKEQVKLLKEALVNLGEMCEWTPKDTFTNDGQIKFQNALTQATEALNQTK